MKPLLIATPQVIRGKPSGQRDPRLGCAPIALATAWGPTRALLLSWAGDLVAVLSEADPEPGPNTTWYVELGWGPCETPQTGLSFDTLDRAVHWAESRCREGGGIGLA